jgi:3'-5' exoribonuclease
MGIIDLSAALEKDRVSQGTVYINEEPQIRSGRKNDFMVGVFMGGGRQVEFKIWDEPIFRPVVKHGSGVYDAEVIGSEFAGQTYLTVRSIAPTSTDLKKSDFLASIPRLLLDANWKQVFSQLSKQGLSAKAVALIEDVLNDPELDGRFLTEGAAIRHHDNLIGGLYHHTTKMLRILSTLFINNPELLESIDLLTFAVVVHDLGKVFEYDHLEPSEFWYASHRVRGIEFLAKYKDRIIGDYDESFYRQIQSTIAEHHGDFGDRPNTVAAAMIHFIDTLESRVTGLIQEQKLGTGSRLVNREWGFLKTLDLGEP